MFKGRCMDLNQVWRIDELIKPMAIKIWPNLSGYIQRERRVGRRWEGGSDA